MDVLGKEGLEDSIHMEFMKKALLKQVPELEAEYKEEEQSTTVFKKNVNK